VTGWAVNALIDTTLFCSPGLCQHHGACIEGEHSFRCDCNMTSFVGRTCTDGTPSLIPDCSFAHVVVFKLSRPASVLLSDATILFL